LQKVDAWIVHLDDMEKQLQEAAMSIAERETKAKDSAIARRNLLSHYRNKEKRGVDEESGGEGRMEMKMLPKIYRTRSLLQECARTGKKGRVGMTMKQLPIPLL
jgi:hypothetical protein